MSLVSTDSRTDATLVAAVRSGSMDALGVLYERYAESLFRTACRFAATPAEAEEAVHDAFVGMRDALVAYRERGRFESWMRRITIRRAIDARVRGRRYVAWPAELVPGDDTNPSPLHAVAIQSALGQLSPRLRDVFVLAEVEGYSRHEIAEIMEARPGTVAVRLSRARKQLRRMLR